MHQASQADNQKTEIDKIYARVPDDLQADIRKTVPVNSNVGDMEF